MKHARAYYTGGFGVGTGVPRVKILQETEYTSGFSFRLNDQLIPYKKYLVQVTSPKAYGYKHGEQFLAGGQDLWDSVRHIPGPKIEMKGKKWRKELES